MSGRELLSVGIDVGTTTTQLVLSRLTVRNKARLGTVPRLDVDSSAVVYQSEPAETPLTAPDEIDVTALVELIRGEYERAGVEPNQVETGAVIITGETARTHNAEVILQGISDLAGDFVVTVAGPNVESQIAGRGSGAADFSAERFTSVINVDIGGGSANAALFRAGSHIASSAAMVGGRQAKLERGTGRLLHLAPSGVIIAKELGLDLKVGAVPSIPALRQLTDAMADIVVDLCTGQLSPLGEKVALSPPMDYADTVTAYFISGGVGLLYYENIPAETMADICAYGDVGPLFATSLKANTRWQQFRVRQPANTLRATVLGAASQQVTLSGSTIWTDDKVLPLRNLPVIEPVLTCFDQATAVTASFAAALDRWDRSGAEGGVAMAVELPERMEYHQLTELAKGIGEFAKHTMPAGSPLVLVTEKDYAQVLGQTIKMTHSGLPLVVIDQIGLGEGDFIDIGEPMLDGRVVPVSVKTLVFYH